MYGRYYQRQKEAAHRVYTELPFIYSPFFKEEVLLSSEGFEHLSVSGQGERSREEQIQRFIFLPLGLHILETATKMRAYRKRVLVIGTSDSHPGSKKRKTVQWWSFAQLFMKQQFKVGVVVRRVGNGKLHFWNVMLHTKWNGPATPTFTVLEREVHKSEPGHAFLPGGANAPTICE